MSEDMELLVKAHSDGNITLTIREIGNKWDKVSASKTLHRSTLLDMIIDAIREQKEES